MSLLTEQLSSAAQNQLAKQISVFQAWSQLAFGGLEKLIALNFNTAKQSLENANNVAHELFAVKQAQELLDLGRAHGQPQLEKILSYGRELASISSDTRAELWQIVSKQGAAVTTVTVATTTATPAIKTIPTPAAKPAVKKLAAKPIAATKQLTLLAEPEVKPTKAPAKPKAVAKVAEKPVSKVAAKPVTKAVAEKAEAKAVEIKPETIKPVAAKSSKPAKTEATKKPLKTSATTADVVPAALAAPAAPVPVITPAAPLPAATTTMIEKTLEKKTTPAKKPAVKTDTADNAAPIKADSKPAASTEKKSAVKFPFAATANLKKGPGFPANNGKPSYKAKSSAATGAKKPVRQ